VKLVNYPGRRTETPADNRVTARRNSGSNFKYPEKRTGFDRRIQRKSHFSRILVSLANHRRAFISILIAVNVLSVLDFLLTMNLLNLGTIAEANPIMADLIVLNPIVAFLYKTSLVLSVTLIFWRFRRYRSVILATSSALVLFSVLIFYQLTLHVFLL